MEVPVTDEEIELYSGAPARGHLPVITKMTTQGTAPSRNIIDERVSIENINWEEWSKDIDSVIIQNREHINKVNEPGELLYILETAIKESTEKHGEKKKVSVHNKPYWNPKLTELSNKLRKARRNWMKRNTDTHREELIAAYKEFDEGRKNECQEFLLNKTKNLNAVEAHRSGRSSRRCFQ